MNHAKPLQRLVAFIIDYAICWFGMKLINKQSWSLDIIDGLTEQEFTEKIAQLILLNMSLCALLVFSYFILCEGILFKATIGKMIMKIKVTGLKGGKIALQASAIRGILKMLPFVLLMFFGVIVRLIKYENPYESRDENFILIQLFVLIIIFIFALISYGLIFVNKKKQTLHDVLAKTVVIRTKDQGLLRILAKKFFKLLKYLRTFGINK